jgi:hypothetical protein
MSIYQSNVMKVLMGTLGCLVKNESGLIHLADPVAEKDTATEAIDLKTGWKVIMQVRAGNV